MKRKWLIYALHYFFSLYIIFYFFKCNLLECTGRANIFIYNKIFGLLRSTIEWTNFVVNPTLISVPRTSWIWYTMPCVTFDFSKHPVHNIFDMPSWEIINVKIVWLMIRCIILQLTFYFLLTLLFLSLTILIAWIGFRGVFSNFYYIKVDVDTYAYEIHSSQFISWTISIVQI